MAKIPLLPLSLPPGIVKNGTPYQVSGRWYDGNQVRWYGGVMQPIGGWAAITTAALAHPARGMLAWTTNTGARYYAVGTSTQLIVGDGSASTWDITPSGYTAGSDNGFQQIGYGGNLYGEGAYGVPIPSGVYLPPSTWSFDLWGDNLVSCCNTDGKIYQWALATNTPSAVVTNAPTNNQAILVTEQQHLMAFGAGGNRRLIQWSDVDGNTVWTPETTNEAGQLPLTTSGVLMGGVRVASQVLAFTNIDVWAGNYLGQPLIWGFNKVGDACGPISAHSMVVAGGNAFWMSDKRFWFYNGSTVQELPCDVANYLFSNMNQSQYGKVTAAVNGAFKEITWYYPSVASQENDSYVSFNYEDNFWMVGTLGRTAAVDKGAFQTPMAVGTDGYIYNHEVGTLANGATRVGTVYATTGALEPQTVKGGVTAAYSAGGGDRITDVTQILTDEKTLGDTELTFTGRYVPNGIEYTYGPYAVRADGYMDVRVSGRQITMTVTPTRDSPWQLGTMRWDARQGAGR